MSRYNKWVLIFVLLFTQMNAFSQYSGSWQTFNENSNRLQGKIMGEMYYLTSLANSNFFMQKDWVEGTITLMDNDVYSRIKLRYLAYGDEIVAFNENIRALFVVDKNIVKEFTVNSNQSGELVQERKFINLNSLNLPGGKSYFEELYSGSAKLLAFHHVDEIKVSPYTDNFGVLRDSEYRLNVTYYLLSNEKGFEKIQRKKTSFYKIYPENKKEIRKIFRKNKIAVSDEGSLIQCFNLLDSAGILN